jgi:aminoglycoside phosphotransferase (APT) family kinase protein
VCEVFLDRAEGSAVPKCETILEVARHLFGAYPQQVILIPTFEDTEVYEIRFPSEHYVLKTTSKKGRESLKIAIEAYIHMLAAAQGVPVPTIVVLDESERLLPTSYFVMYKVQGVQIQKAELTPDQKKLVLRRLGEVLRLLHSVQLAGFGKPDIDRYYISRQIYGCSLTWNSYLRDRALSDLRYLKASRVLCASLIDHITELLRSYEQNRADLQVSCLLHGDLTMEHVWVGGSGDNVSAIIDFGDAVIGDPLWDFVYYDSKKASVLECILDGYSTIDLTTDFWSRLSVYKLIYAVGVLAWAHKRKISDLSTFIDNLRTHTRNVESSVEF